MSGENKLYKRFFIFIFLFPSVAGVILFYFYPMAQAAYLSFTDYNTLAPAKFIGFNNYLKVFTQANSLKAILNTFKFIIAYIPLVVSIGIIISVVLNKEIKFIKLFRLLYFIPVITSWVAVSIIWRWLYNGKEGLINYLLSLAGIHGPIWLNDFFWAMPAIILTSVWKDLGWVSIILLSGLQNIDNEYYEASTVDGAGGIQKFLRITLPLLTPSIFFVIIISMINSFQLFDQVVIMTNGGPVNSTTTIVHQVYLNAFENYKMGFASAQSMVLFLIVLVVTLAQNILEKRWVVYETK